MIIKIEKLKKSYNGVPVLDIQALNLPSGSITAIVGPTGAGKSTLLNLIGDLIEKDEGKIWYDGEISVPLKKMTLVFQAPYLISTTVRENIAYPMKLRKMEQHVIDEKIQALSEELNLSHLLAKKANQLSLGESQKVALARAMSFEPELLMLDEPSASIDPYTTSEIEKILIKMNREKKITMLIVTHNLVQARRLADYVVLLNKGKVVECCDSQTFFQCPSEQATRKFIEGELLI